MAITPKTGYRLPRRTLDQIEDIRHSAKAGTVLKSAVVIQAIDALHRDIFGRRSVEIRPVTVRPGSKRAVKR